MAKNVLILGIFCTVHNTINFFIGNFRIYTLSPAYNYDNYGDSDFNGQYAWCMIFLGRLFNNSLYVSYLTNIRSNLLYYTRQKNISWITPKRKKMYKQRLAFDGPNGYDFSWAMYYNQLEKIQQQEKEI
jgi:hypothetical protein